MLGFFRKYQKYFYVMITIVIVISFSFFGTYSTLESDRVHDPIVFTAVDGTEIPRSQLEEMVLFLGTDAEDKVNFGGIWGPNFLNDGVVKRDILGRGLAQVLVADYLSELNQDLNTRHAKEKRFQPYRHPQAPFIGVTNVWEQMAPDVKKHFDALRSGKSPVDPEVFDARVNLYLAQRAISPPLLMQIFRYQERQYPQVQPDPNLERTDLSLFGYHTLDDWFGPRFMRLVGQFVINSSKLAEQRGYQVTKEEALADLLRNAQKSYQQNLRNPRIGVANYSEYFNEQLRRMGLDQNRAIRVWQKVLLFRRLFQDSGNAVVVDPFTVGQFYHYANEATEGDLYQLPESLRFNDFGQFQKFQIYLDAVSGVGVNSLDLPTKFKSVSEVEKNYPELVQRRYLVKMAAVNKKMLETRVGVRETWEWQVKDANWELLKKEFPDIGVSKARTEHERFEVLDSLPTRVRERVDAFARSTIVDTHPEWFEEAMVSAQPREVVLSLRKRGGRSPIAGLKDPQELINQLDASDEVERFSADDQMFYKIEVLDRAGEKEILTFAEANREGVLDELLNRRLQAYYLEIRREHPNKFQHVDKTWKDFVVVKDDVARIYFKDVIDRLSKRYPTENGKILTDEWLASNRLRPYAEKMWTEVKRAPESQSQFVVEVQSENDDSFAERQPLENQWKMVSRNYQIERNRADRDFEEIFQLNVGEWSGLLIPRNGDISFFHVKKKGADAEKAVIAEEMVGIHQMLSNDAQQVLMRQIVEEINAKEAFNLEYMNPRGE